MKVKMVIFSPVDDASEVYYNIVVSKEINDSHMYRHRGGYEDHVKSASSISEKVVVCKTREEFDLFGNLLNKSG